MRLLVSIVTSLICGTAVAAVLYRYVVENAATPTFWQSDPIGTLWAGFGGAGGIVVLAYLVFAFALVTSYAYLDLGAARTRLARAAAESAEPPDQHWRTAFADTDFRAIAGQLTPYELAAAPLSLLRVLRTEIWRVYAKRLLCGATVALALGGIALAVGPLPLPATPSLSAAATRWQALAGFIVLVVAGATWLGMDNAIGRLATTMTGLSAAWTDAPPIAIERLERRPVGEPRPAVRAADDLVTAVDRLVVALSAHPPAAPAAGEHAGEALDGLKAALREAADQQRQAIEQLGSQLATQAEEFVRRAEAAATAPSEVAALGAAMAQLSAAVDKLADPVLRRLQMLGATDRRLLTILKHQENAVGTVTSRWSELVAALQAMSAGLDSVVQTAAQDGRRAAPANPAEINDELQELLDEISANAAAPRRQA